MDWPEKFFITGTDTGIGKTLVSAMLMQELAASYWKPVQSGLEGETDTEAVKRLTALPENHFKPETYRLTEPLSPHASAEIDGVKIKMCDFKLPDYDTDHLIVEGAGGVMVPLNDKYMMIDLMAQLNLPVLIVARSKLGTLNHTFLTLEALRHRDIPILGVIMNGTKNESNRRAIEQYGNIEVRAEIEHIDNPDAGKLQKIYKQNFK